jgi:hypothetical protein
MTQKLTDLARNIAETHNISMDEALDIVMSIVLIIAEE